MDVFALATARIKTDKQRKEKEGVEPENIYSDLLDKEETSYDEEFLKEAEEQINMFAPRKMIIVFGFVSFLIFLAMVIRWSRSISNKINVTKSGKKDK